MGLTRGAAVQHTLAIYGHVFLPPKSVHSTRTHTSLLIRKEEGSWEGGRASFSLGYYICNVFSPLLPSFPAQDNAVVVVRGRSKKVIARWFPLLGADVARGDGCGEEEERSKMLLPGVCERGALYHYRPRVYHLHHLPASIPSKKKKERKQAATHSCMISHIPTLDVALLSSFPHEEEMDGNRENGFLGSTRGQRTSRNWPLLWPGNANLQVDGEEELEFTYPA